MKKILAVILAALLCFGGVVGCTESGNNLPLSVQGKACSVAVGQTTNLEVADGDDGISAQWSTSDRQVAVVHDGEVTGVSAGTAVITADFGNKTATYKVSVTENEMNTTHVYAVYESDYKLIENGKTDYVIVYSAEETDELIRETAVQELQYFFKEASGIDIKAVGDASLRYTPSETYLSIGETKISREAGISVDKEKLGDNGYQILSEGRSVFMIGGGRFGTLYSVYEFLKWQFGYEQYAVDEFEIERNLQNKNLMHFDVTDIPDFQYRLGNYGEYWSGDLFPKRMRMHQSSELWMKLGGVSEWHNYMHVIPPAIYKDEHPDWYSADGVQLCLTRDVEGLSNEVVEQMKKCIEANPKLSMMTFTQQDYNVWCTCPSCTALKQKYGVNSASNILFINVVARKLKAWLNEAHPDRDITISIFAYHQVEEAPATLGADGKYVPMDDSLILEDNVAVQYAPIFANNYLPYDEEHNERLVTTMQKWHALTDNIYMWIYSTYFGNYLAPYDSFNAMQSKYIYLYENDVKYLFDQGQYNQNVGTDWYRLKEYLSSKMQWNVYGDMDALTAEFFDHYFKDASESMMKYYRAYRTYYAYLSEELGVDGEVGNIIDTERYWPERVLGEWLGYIDEAYSDIQHLKASDPVLYQKLEDRITLESISLRHLVLKLYESSYTPTEYEQMYRSFVDDCNRLGVNNFNEWNALQSYFNRFD